MILQSLRLRNIKSYGNGADGAGVTVEFAPGINRIAGRNGHGKTTLIEALGYALFFARPVFEENFDAATYLLRAGKKEGEIDVTFSHGGETYRVERGLGGQSRRRAKVVQFSDGSIAAEGDDEVVRFLCRLFGLVDAAHLAELFAKLAGVKQGRLTWPFDSKAAEARRHFEPLLEVEIFRQCFDRLKPVMDEYEALQHAEETKRAAVQERIRERSDSAEQVKSRETQVQTLEQQTAQAKAALDAADKTKRQLEAREKALLDARRLRDLARHAVALAAEKGTQAARQLDESRQAATTVAETAADAEAFTQAEAALKQLHDRQQEKAALDRERADANTQRAELAGQAAGAEELAKTFLQQRETKAQALAELEAKARELAATLAGGAAAALAESQRVEQSAAEKLEAATGALTAAREARRTLQTQLDEIAGGVCPFLKEQCRQFDRAKVRGDLRAQDANIQAAEGRLAEAREAHRRAKKQLEAATAQHTQLTLAIKTHTTQAASATAERKALAEKAAAKSAEAKQFQARAEVLARTVSGLDDRLKPLNTLGEEVRVQQERKARHEPGHRRFLVAKPLAEARGARQQAFEAAQHAEVNAATDLKQKDDAFTQAGAAFDPAALETARKLFQETHAQVATLAAHVANAKTDLAREQKRLREYEAALKEHAVLERELGHLRAATALTQKARTLLQKAAPYVAQHICRRIAQQAQQLFNRISLEPAELEWDAKHYSLRVHPGERRFAMLSGGEQTKLALAMTLAMIRDFSGLKFCVFDEPTYGVDAESRDRLADAIVEAQAAAGFEQVLLVSHDDVFDGKIEHVVLLKKTAAGTQVESR
jgi:exonuclease SbcC